MATSSVLIANMALGHIGISDRIESLTEASVPAGQANLWYDPARKQALAAHDWNFARKRLTLAEHGVAPPTNWGFRYQYPADCLQIRRLPNPIGENALAIAYEVEMASDNTKSILTNLESAEALYTFDQTEPALFSEFFVMTLSYLMAMYMCMALTQKQSLHATMERAYLRSIAIAPAHNANEGVSLPYRDAEWISGSGRGEA